MRRPDLHRAASRTARGLVAALGLAAAVGAASAQETDLETRALALVNEARTDAGLEALEYSASLGKAARQHAEDMLERDYYAHESPQGETFDERIREAGGDWTVTAENIARCKGCSPPPGTSRVERFHEGWMDSAPHRRNILKEGLTDFGFGIAGEGDTIYAVQTFGGR